MLTHAPMAEHEYDGVIIDKPWGYEYLMFQNQDAALWCLFLRRGECTSLHCHPRKKTGLILLAGSATLRFLNNSTTLVSPANVMIRAGLFHQSAADLGTDVVLIEIESPVDKANLVRLKDEYGREKAAYEDVSAARPVDETVLRLPEPVEGETPTWQFHGRTLRLHRVPDAAPFAASLQPGDIVIVLDGGLFTDDGEPILTAGDSVSASTLMRLSRSFGSPKGLAALVVLGAAAA